MAEYNRISRGTFNHSTGMVDVTIIPRCQSRKTPAIGAKDITLSLISYLPLDSLSSSIYPQRTIIGNASLPSIRVTAGNTYNSYDGKRLVLEVGCNTVIFLQISPGNGLKHHRFFIQEDQYFSFDITTRLMSSIVHRDSKPLLTVIKYEIYFITGFFSTVGVAAWLTVTGSDVTVTLLGNKQKMKAYRNLAVVWTVETTRIKVYAPTLHQKMMLVIDAEKEKLMTSTIKELPKAVVTDEKAQAQTAGILAGKHVLSPKSLTVWGAVGTVAIQATVKSASNLPDAAKEAFDKRYLADVKDFANTDWYDVNEKKKAISRMAELLNSAKIPVTTAEVNTIIKEIQARPKELTNALVNIAKAIQQLK